MNKIYRTKEEVLKKAKTALHKSLRLMLSQQEIESVESKIGEYGMKRKGYFGNLIEKYFFEISPGNVSEPDFRIAGVELKTTPLKRRRDGKYVSKERLVFSMINYEVVVNEVWESSTFLSKNKLLLLMFYLWVENRSIIDYEFEFVYLLNLIEDISEADVFQIQKDWEYIVAKIRRGEAHLLSEGDTYYLGACTKASDGSVVREQPVGKIPAKPRAFSFKQQYLNYLIQTKLLGEETNTDSIFKKQRRVETIEEAIRIRFTPYLGKTDREILSELNSDLERRSKSYKRLIVNRILGVKSEGILELEKANITLRAVTLESSGALTESISFPAFQYRDLVSEIWDDNQDMPSAELHTQLETKKFLFVVFQKVRGDSDVVLKKVIFWNFPMSDIAEAERIWRKTIDLINSGKIVREIKLLKNGSEVRYTYFPTSRDSKVLHVRPHGKNSADVSELPVRDLLTGEKKYTKHSFWLNAKYIQKVIEEG